MAGRKWTAAVLTALAWNCTALPQSGEGQVVTLRTAGQPERKLQVLKSERLPDGKILTEVKDLATGAIFTIADTKPLGTPTAALPVATPSTAAPAMLPGTTVPVNSNLPQARARNADPLLGGAANPQPVQPQPQYPTLVGKLRGNQTAPQNVVAPAPGTKQQSAVSAALFGNYNTPAQPQPTLIRSNPTTTAAATTAAPANNTPTLMGKLFGDKPAPVQPQAGVAKAPSVIRPNAVPAVAARAPVTTVAKPVETVNYTPQNTVTYAPQGKAYTPPPEPATLTPVSTDSRDPNFHVVPVKPMTMKQIEDMVKDLRMHSRPSVRVEAAMALASCPMSGMVEVRQILAEASYRDPEPVVRAHCIDLLTKMQYDEPNYKKYVETLVNSEELSLQRASRAALR